jgi:hypothetical protein
MFLADVTLLQSAADSMGVAASVLKAFLADAAGVRRTVPSPNPSCPPIFAHDSPCERRAAILAASTVKRGASEGLPFRASIPQAERLPARHGRYFYSANMAFAHYADPLRPPDSSGVPHDGCRQRVLAGRHRSVFCRDFKAHRQSRIRDLDFNVGSVRPTFVASQIDDLLASRAERNRE